jgi:transcriptional regulator with XRE-family HTH domain
MKSPHPVDVHVGGRVRMRRIEVKMAQQVLGAHIDLTFQQIQKYEKGTNRIGASRLQEIGKVLEVPAAYFFEGAPGGWDGEGDKQTSPALLDILGTREGQILFGSFSRISDPEIRRALVVLVEGVATSIENRPKPRKRKPKPKK